MKHGLLIAGALTTTAVIGCGPPLSGIVSEGAEIPHTAAQPVAETEPVRHSGDAADDPAIWVDSRDPSRSTVIATDERGGIAVYDLSGREIQYRADGDVNNVDLREEFPLGGRRVALVAATEKRRNAIVLYRVDPASRRLVRLPTTGIDPALRVHGLCMYRSDAGHFYVFVDSENGKVEQWELFDAGRGRIGGRRVRSFDFNRLTESCVADDAEGQLYLAAERKGIWRIDANPRAAASGERAIGDSRKRLVPEVEGLAIAATRDGDRFLLASSQGSSTFAAYALPGYAYQGSFRLASRDEVDEVSGTDGIDVTTSNLGGDLVSGLFVAQDDTNDGAGQNYKLVPWGAVERALDRFAARRLSQ